MTAGLGGGRIIGTPMRVILDTNVWLDWLVFDDPRVLPIADAIARGDAEVLATAPMLDEFRAVIVRPHFRLDEAAREVACAHQRSTVHLHSPAPDCRLACTDPDDRMFIDLAVGAHADWLLSRDKALLRLRRVAHRRFGLHIGTPEHWSAARAATAGA